MAQTTHGQSWPGAVLGKFSAASVSVRTIPEVQSEVLARMVSRSVWWPYTALQALQSDFVKKYQFFLAPYLTNDNTPW